jgi:hypothetical protein
MTVHRSLANGLILVEAPDGGEPFLDVAQWAVAQCIPTWNWSDVLSSPVRVLMVPDIAKPPWAEGLTRSANRVVRVVMQTRRGRPRRNRMAYIMLHELAGHMVDADHLTGRRAGIRALMIPRPTSWSDDDGLEGMARYWHLPSEAYANRIVEAITAKRVVSPFDDDYTRNIPDADLGHLVEVVTAPPLMPTEPEPELPEVPTPPEPDPALEICRARVAELEAAIAHASEDLDGAGVALPTPPEV